MTPELTKLRLLHERAQREQAAAEELAYIARRKREASWDAYYERGRQLGFCVLCEKPLTECTGHIALAKQRAEGIVRQPEERADMKNARACPHCGSVACAKGGGQMSGYWVIHPGCAKARAAKGLPPFRVWDAPRRPQDDEALDAEDHDAP